MAKILLFFQKKLYLDFLRSRIEQSALEPASTRCRCHELGRSLPFRGRFRNHVGGRNRLQDEVQEGQQREVDVASIGICSGAASDLTR